jgi:branched-chain amino acid transport system ATP-binding protein
VTPILEVRGVTKRFGGIQALAGPSFEVPPEAICGLIGPNGSGKSTLFDCITGVTPIDGGEVRFRGERISGLAPYRIARCGIGRTFQLTRLFPRLSVLENLLAVAGPRAPSALTPGSLRLHPATPSPSGGHPPLSGGYPAGTRDPGTPASPPRATELPGHPPHTLPFGRVPGGHPGSGRVPGAPGDAERRARELIDFVSLTRVTHELAANLSYGQSKLLEFIRALMLEPTLVMLDEPAAGVNPTLLEKIVGYIRELRDRGVTFLIVEHNMRLVMNLCDTVVVLDHGEKIAEGPPRAVQDDERVIEAYFGR